MTEQETKSIEAAQAQSIQERTTRSEVSSGIAVLHLLASGAGIVPAWWSPSRDAALDKFWKLSNHLSGAYYTLASKLTAVPFRVEPRDASVKAWRRQAEQYQAMLVEESEFGQGWAELWSLALVDLWTQDNGLFVEVIGDGRPDGPIVGPALGLAHLDAWRCTRTGNPEFPVVYQDTDGTRYKLHRSRVMFTSQVPSSRAEMFRVGYCWTSRALDAAQNLVDIATYKQEKLGSRPQRAILTTRGGLDPETVQDAFEAAESAMSGRNLTRYSKFVVVGDPTMPDAGLDMLDLASLPDGFDEKTSADLGMYVISLTGAVPPRWLWPATTTGATKADAMYQHVAGLTGGPGATLNLIATMLGGSKEGPRHVAGKFLPPQLKIIFDFQDDEQDRQQAEIRDVRSQQRERDINSGVYTVQVARQQALATGDIDDDQYETMELADGRTPEGTEVLNLFYSDDPDMAALLDVGVDDPLLVLANDPVEVLTSIEDAMLAARDVLINATRGIEQRRANQALAALSQLKGLYLEEAVGAEEPTEEEEQPEEEQEAEGEQETETQPEPETPV